MSRDAAAPVARELELGSRTELAWAEAVLRDPLALLSDHAHCELGAASTACSLIARRPAATRLVDSLSQLAAEEMRHFRRVHALLVRLGGELGPTRRNAYAEGLVRRIERPAPDAFLDRLVVAAFIERRSCERFELLAGAARRCAPELARLFLELGPSERAHARLFLDLARELFPKEDLEARVARWRGLEAEQLASLPFATRLHSGSPGGPGTLGSGG